MNHIQASLIEGFMLSVGGLFDKDSAKSVQDYLKKLRDA